MSQEMNMIDGSDKHCALAFLASDHMKYIKCVQYGKHVRGYYFDNTKALWKMFNHTDELFNVVSDFLEPYYIQLINKHKYIISKIDIEDKHKQREGTEILKILNASKKSMCSRSKVANITSLILTGIVDVSFMKVIDGHTTLLPIKNKRIIDLRTLEIRQREWSDYFTYELDVDLIDNKLDDHTNTPNAFKYFTQVMSEYGQTETPKTDYFIDILGYSITKETNLKEFYLWYGPLSNNGKSTCFNLISTIFESLTTTLGSDIITNTKSDDIQKANFAILGKRIGAINELSENLVLGESNCKTITGACDSIMARALYFDAFSFIPIIKIHILSNYELMINVDQPAMVNRFTVITFNSEFSENPKGENQYLIETEFIEDLKTKYKNEVFTMIVKGAYKYYLNKKKIIKPDIIIKEKQKYIDQISYVKNFINEQCVTGEQYKTKGKLLYDTFIEYCKETGDRFNGITIDNFYSRLKTRGFSFKVINGYKYIDGITLCSEAKEFELLIKTDKDIVKCYLSTHCEKDDKYKVRTTELFNNFHEQNIDSGFSNLTFKNAMIDNGFTVYKTGGYDNYKGLRIKQVSNFNNSIFKAEDDKPDEIEEDIKPIEKVKEVEDIKPVEKVKKEKVKKEKVKEVKPVEKVKEAKKDKVKEVKPVEKVKEVKKDKVKETKKEKVKEVKPVEKVKEVKKEKVKETKKEKVKEVKKEKDAEKSKEVVTLDLFDNMMNNTMQPKAHISDANEEDDDMGDTNYDKHDGCDDEDDGESDIYDSDDDELLKRFD